MMMLFSFEPTVCWSRSSRQRRNSGSGTRFHTPNALNARFINPDLARLMVQAGFAGFFLGLESRSPSWQHSTGNKVQAHEFEAGSEMPEGRRSPIDQHLYYCRTSGLGRPGIGAVNPFCASVRYKSSPVGVLANSGHRRRREK